MGLLIASRHEISWIPDYHITIEEIEEAAKGKFKALLLPTNQLLPVFS